MTRKIEKKESIHCLPTARSGSEQNLIKSL